MESLIKKKTSPQKIKKRKNIFGFSKTLLSDINFLSTKFGKELNLALTKFHWFDFCPSLVRPNYFLAKKIHPLLNNEELKQ